MEKSADAFRTISEVADELVLPQHVLRFWETRFTQIKPLKRGGGRRYYRPDDVELLRAIRHLLYGEGYTIKGVQRILKEQGARAVIALRQGGAASSSPLPPYREPGVDMRYDAAGAPSRAETDLFDAPDEAGGEDQIVHALPDDDEQEGGFEPHGGRMRRARGEIRDLRLKLESVLADLDECQRLLNLARTH
ncbi:MerR family transcriptional regulator [Methylovirgula sp. 4M-Z18]|uniref:MerR family transcriptional regulator n=1 Tax=Methylovirgula sp. 4M-Z18 TaxID=2293567 RepID=UPI000E2F555C|nr:MerR family transcriptional regulator [Methylovirgula sp. 4M-Z18]RFB80301.1 MerR family transcriptional regulator [Methylovirgula sp. 4M-Z18]